jgi:hypothetical protein
MAGIAFENVGALHPGKTRFDWRKTRKFDCEFGQIIPIFTKFCVPGDFISINNDTLVRCTPLIHPTMHEITIDTHYFFVPERLLDDCNSRPGTGNPAGDPLILGTNQPPANRFNWELFISGGFDGLDAQELPRWKPSNGTPPDRNSENFNQNVPAPYKYSLWDYMGLPVLADDQTWGSTATPRDSIRRAYNFIYNEYYRDETLIKTPVSWDNEFILNRAWRKDYFTSSLPFRQRGIAPGLPMTLSGETKTIFDGLVKQMQSGVPNYGAIVQMDVNSPPGLLANANGGSSAWADVLNSGSPALGAATGDYGTQFLNWLNTNHVDLTAVSSTAFDISDLRLAFQMQKWLERNARAGVRYNEFVKAHWGREIKDFRLWRPEYIGGSKTPIIISEVTQTGESGTTPQGNMAGHGISVSGNHIGEFSCDDYGWVIGLQTVMPIPSYQQGIERTLLYDIRESFPTPEFVNLSEQLIYNAELYINNDSTDLGGWGYVGIYDELRTENNQVCGAFRDSLADWHLGRIFDTQPLLNQSFIELNAIPLRRIFADQQDPGLLCDVEHEYYMVRPIPEIAEPGLIDHH